MAQHALARPCPSCGTLVTAGGNFADKELFAQCGTCGRAMVIANPISADTPADTADVKTLKAELEAAKARDAAREEELAELRALLDRANAPTPIEPLTAPSAEESTPETLLPQPADAPEQTLPEPNADAVS